MSADRDEFYRRQARERLGAEMFDACIREALAAPPPTPTQIATIARIFRPALRRAIQRETPQQIARVA